MTPSQHAATLPTGTVTMLFTDIEGSTRLLMHLGAQYAQVLGTYRALLRDVFARHGGREVDTQGDGFFVVFHGAGDAVTAAIDAQRALAAHSWPDAGAVRVRMAVHTGEPSYGAEGYVGLDVHLAARLCAAGHGGQILLSAITAELIGREAGPRFTVRPLGAHQLKDIDRPEPVFQIEAQGLAIEFPPLRAPARAMSVAAPDDGAVAFSYTARPFVGRDRERAHMSTALEVAATGQGRLILLTGEPGIGKTRLAEELCAHAGPLGWLPLWGRCHEGEGAPSFWPWVQILRGLTALEDLETLRRLAGSGAEDLAALVPELQGILPELPAPVAFEGDHDRFRLFDSVARFLKAASRANETAANSPSIDDGTIYRRGLILVLEDLHWADASSLLLLEFLARDLAGAALLIIATYRDIDVAAGGPLARTLGVLNRISAMERIPLSGLTQEDVHRYVQLALSTEASEALAQNLYRGTEGNPFFLTESVHLLKREADTAPEGPAGRAEGSAAPGDGRAAVASGTFRVPQSVREVIDRRLSDLSPGCREVLTIAAVIGHEFSVGILQRVTDGSGSQSEHILDMVEEAESAHVIGEMPGAIGRYAFAHGLIRDTLLDGLTGIRRARFHRRVAEALELAWSAHLEPHVAELAYHFLAAISAGDPDKAAAYSLRAAAAAMKALAYEESVRLLEAAVTALEAHDPGGEHRRCELVLALGEARSRAGDVPGARSAYDQTIAVARALHASEPFARAAIGLGVTADTGKVDQRVIGLLEEALGLLSPEDSALRSRGLAQLAMNLYWTQQPERMADLSLEAVEMARRLGDAAALAGALTSRHWVLYHTRHAGERLAIASEIIAIATAAGDRRLEVDGHLWRLSDALEYGDVATAERALEAHARLAEEVRQPQVLWFSGVLRTMWALLHGHLDDCEQLMQRALAVGAPIQHPDVLPMYALQLFGLRREQGRVQELEGFLPGFAYQYPALPVLRAGLADFYLNLDRIDEARAEFERLAADNFTSFPLDVNWLSAMVTLADLCCSLEDPVRAVRLYDLLVPYAERVTVVGSAVLCLGSVARPLGRLAALLGRWEAASAHFEYAAAVHARMAAPTLLARTRFDHAAMLLRQVRLDDRSVPEVAKAALRSRTAVLLTDVLATTEDLGMARLSREAAALKSTVRAVPPHTPIATAVPEGTARSLPAGLSTREVEVLRLLAAGNTSKEIADNLVVSVHTVHNHIASIYAKIGARRRVDATAFALRHGLV